MKYNKNGERNPSNDVLKQSCELGAKMPGTLQVDCKKLDDQYTAAYIAIKLIRLNTTTYALEEQKSGMNRSEA